MKIALSLLLTMSMVFTLAACGTKDPAPVETGGPDQTPDSVEELTPMTLQNADGGTIEEISTIANGRFCDIITERTDGKLTIEWFPAGQLGSLAESAEALTLGTMDLAKVDSSLIGQYSPVTELLSLPFLIKDFDHADKVLNGDVGDMIAKQIEEDCGIVVLSWLFVGFRNFCTKTPITSVSDCKDILLRSPEGQIYMDTFNLLSMKPTPLPYGEMYTAMQTGVVDAVETTPEVIYTSEFYKLGKYVCVSNHMFTTNFIGINADLFYSLPQDWQDLLREVGEEVAAEEQADIIANADMWYEKLADDGAVITEFDNYQELLDLFTPYWEEAAERIGGNSQEIIDAIIALA